MSTVVGIDLGTTNSLIGTVVDGGLQLFTDERGDPLMPSAVGMDRDGSLLVGRAARNRRLVDPQGTALSVKREMGKDTLVRVGQRDLSPVQVSSLILASLLDRAEKALGGRPERAIITVPAYFTDAQRQATRDAGELAGLTIERLINEPTAAALTFQTGVEEHVLVYDLGGGTFDVSILERDEGYLEVKASRGDTALGGDDIDAALLQLVLQRLGNQGRRQVEQDAIALVRLANAVERAKVALSSQETVTIHEPFLTGTGASALHVEMSLSRAELEAAADGLLSSTLKHIDAAMADAKLKPTDLDRVVLVGGVSKMPRVAAMVAQHLNRPVLINDEADRAVALGAAMLAGRAGGEDVREVLVDITPHTLALGSLTEESSLWIDTSEADLAAIAVIPRDTAVPVRRTKRLQTLHPNQKAVAVPVVQGEGQYVGDNTRLGNVVVDELPPSPAGSPVDVTFTLDISGVLHVSAVHVPSGRTAAVSIADSPYRLSAQRRERAQAELDELRAAGSDSGDAASADEEDVGLARAMVARAERVLERQDLVDDLRARLQAAVEQATEAIAQSRNTTAAVDALSDVLFDVV